MKKGGHYGRYSGVTKYLVDIWRGSKCPDTHGYLFECKKCKYNELCAKLDELAKVVGK